jgi:hypothetical protein
MQWPRPQRLLHLFAQLGELDISRRSQRVYLNRSLELLNRFNAILGNRT